MTNYEILIEFEDMIKKSVRWCRGWPIAMSGGLDSSILAYFAKPLYGVTVRSSGGKAYDESRYAKIVAKHLDMPLKIIDTEDFDFKEDVKKAIKIIGMPIPHFNVFPLYIMFKTLKEEWNESKIIIADGPDESMCGYARQLIVDYLYKIYDFEAFKSYENLINKILPPPMVAYERLSGHLGTFDTDKPLANSLCKVDMEYKRPEMNTMTDKLAKHFGIKVYRPFETKKLDKFMFNLPNHLKINSSEYGKYALRLVADEYLPKSIVWRKVKRGGPIYPVNKKMGWNKTDGEFGKYNWMKYQEEVLSAKA